MRPVGRSDIGIINKEKGNPIMKKINYLIVIIYSMNSGLCNFFFDNHNQKLLKNNGRFENIFETLVIGEIVKQIKIYFSLLSIPSRKTQNFKR